MEEEPLPIKELIDLSGKCAIVTGGARGIGHAICWRLLEAGASIVIADTDEEAGRNVIETLGKDDNRLSFIECDVSNEEQVRRMITEADSRHDGIYILVNNAGIYPRKPFGEMTGSDFQRVLDINLTGTFLCSRYASEIMIERKQGGSIINIASIEAVHPSSTGMTAYDASKAGVVMLTKSLARELGPNSIRVNAIAPGGILTRALTSQLGETTEETQQSQLRELKDFMKRMALGRMGEADDIARVVLFLASDLAGYITGDLITVDGGYLVS